MERCMIKPFPIGAAAAFGAPATLDGTHARKDNVEQAFKEGLYSVKVDGHWVSARKKGGNNDYEFVALVEASAFNNRMTTFDEHTDEKIREVEQRLTSRLKSFEDQQGLKVEQIKTRLTRLEGQIKELSPQLRIDAQRAVELATTDLLGSAKDHLQRWLTVVMNRNAQLQMENKEKEIAALLADMDARSNADGEDVNDAGFEVVFPPGCFLRNTVLSTPLEGLKTVDTLKVGDQVRGSDGRTVEVSYKKIHPQELRRLVTLVTAQGELTVTLDHRVAIPSDVNHEGEKLAKELTLGDEVLCGKRTQTLAKVTQFEDKVEVVELRFNPDCAVESWMVQLNQGRHGILTKGERMPGAWRPMGKLGPLTFETPNAIAKPRLRAQSW